MGREHPDNRPATGEAGKPGEGRRVVRGAQEFVCGHRELMRRQEETLRAVITAQSNGSAKKEG